MFDPFEYLMLRHKAGKLRTDFKTPLGKVSYQVPCHLRVQNIGLKTRDMLQLVPDTTVEAIERCSGPRRHLCGEEGIPRDLGEDRPAGGEPGREGRGRSLRQRLPDGRRPDRARAQGRHRANHPADLLRMAYGI
jgi:glycerol-3-phosphate dehydrogenase subunit C